MNTTTTSPLSSIPVQFLIYVDLSNETCEQKMDFVPPTPPEDACIGVPQGTVFEGAVVVRLEHTDRRYIDEDVYILLFYYLKTSKRCATVSFS